MIIFMIAPLKYMLGPYNIINLLKYSFLVHFSSRIIFDQYLCIEYRYPVITKVRLYYNVCEFDFYVNFEYSILYIT